MAALRTPHAVHCVLRIHAAHVVTWLTCHDRPPGQTSRGAEDSAHTRRAPAHTGGAQPASSEPRRRAAARARARAFKRATTHTAQRKRTPARRTRSTPPLALAAKYQIYELRLTQLQYAEWRAVPPGRSAQQLSKPQAAGRRTTKRTRHRIQRPSPSGPRNPMCGLVHRRTLQIANIMASSCPPAHAAIIHHHHMLAITSIYISCILSQGLERLDATKPRPSPTPTPSFYGPILVCASPAVAGCGGRAIPLHAPSVRPSSSAQPSRRPIRPNSSIAGA
jgi:hypothetical protein